MLAQLADVLPAWVFLAIHFCGLVPALAAIWLRLKGDRLSGAWPFVLVLYYATLAFLFGILLLNARWRLSLPSTLDALGCGGFLLAIAGIPIGFAMTVQLSTPTLRDATQRCERCGYDLTKNESGRCPECGLVREKLGRGNAG